MLNYEFPPIGGGGGAVTRDLGGRLVDMGHRVDVVTMSYRGLPREETVGGVRVFRVPSLRRRKSSCSIPEMLSYLAGARIFLRRHIPSTDYDIVHCHFAVPTGPLALFLRRRYGLPYVLTCHGSDIPGHNPDKFTLAHRFTRPLLRRIMGSAAAVTAPSAFLGHAIECHLGDYNVTVVPNGIDTALWRPGEKSNIILMAGRLLRFKGFHCVLEALKDVRADFEVHVAGDGVMRDELARRAKAVPMPVHFHGWLDGDGDAFRDLFRRAAIFCMPSESESFGVVFVQAMCAGCAVLGSTAAAIPEVVEDGVTGLLVPPGDVAATRDALARLVRDAGFRADLAEAGRRRALESYAWPEIAAQYAALYADAAQSARN